MPDAGDQPAKRDRGMVWFYVAMGAVAALMGLGVWLKPVAQIHYHAWQYRRTHDRRHFEYVASALVARQAPREGLASLLGKPAFTNPEYDAYWTNETAPPEWVSQYGDHPLGDWRYILLRDGRAVELARPGYMHLKVTTEPSPANTD